MPSLVCWARNILRTLSIGSGTVVVTVSCSIKVKSSNKGFPGLDIGMLHGVLHCE